MKFIHLIWAGVWRKRGRTLLTLLSIINAFLLLGLLQGFAGGVAHAVSDTRADILVTYSRISQNEPLPIALAPRILAVDGVDALTPALVFQGTYANVRRPVRAFAVEPEQFLRIYPKMGVTAQQVAALSQTRSGALISIQMAKTYGWKTGDRVPLKSSMWPNRDGTRIWPVEIVGVYTPIGAGAGGNPMLLNFDYIDQGRTVANGTTSFLFMRITDPNLAGPIASKIDRLFANSPYETKTVTESQLSQDALRQIGDVQFVINAVVGAVLFALLLSVGAVISQSMRERIPEIAVLKTLGFDDGMVLRILLAETFTICMIGSLIGLGLSTLLFPLVEKTVGLQLQVSAVMIWGLLIAAVLALLAGLPPALRAQRLQIVDALAGR